MYKADETVALMDLGTNGEIVLGNRQNLLCASTAAGPAFEGACIRMGMRAAPGAISQVSIREGALICYVIGNTAPRGICGSGLVDAVAAGLESGVIQPNGRLQNNGCKEFSLSPPVVLTQSDIRELQLAKAALASGLRILLDIAGRTIDEVEHLYLAGAFGNYIYVPSAYRLGHARGALPKSDSCGQYCTARSQNGSLVTGDRQEHIGDTCQPRVAPILSRCLCRLYRLSRSQGSATLHPGLRSIATSWLAPNCTEGSKGEVLKIT